MWICMKYSPIMWQKGARLGETGYNEAVSALASILTLLHWPVYLNWPEQEQPFYAPKHSTIAMHCPRFQPVVSHAHCFQGLKFIPSTGNAYLAAMSYIDMWQSYVLHESEVLTLKKFHILLAEATIGQFARVGHFTIGQFAGFKVCSLGLFHALPAWVHPKPTLQWRVCTFAQKGSSQPLLETSLNVFAKFFNNLVKRCYGGEEASGILHWTFCKLV